MSRSAERIQEELLVLDAQEGRREAFEDLFRRWHPRLLRFAWHLSGREDVARDVVQEGWIAIIKGLSGLSDPAAFPTWAYRIVRFKAADQARNQARQRELLEPTAESAAPS